MTLGATATTTAQWYARFAAREASGESAIYESWARGVAGDPVLLALIEELPRPRRQPVLFFAVTRLCGAPEGSFAEWRDWVTANWSTVRAEALVRLTQTNDPRRCAALLLVLARLKGPIALLEVGASAGLCIYPDRYSYRYDGGQPLHPSTGPSAVVIDCATGGGTPVPTAMPRIVWRAGIDLAPLDVANPADARWLETLLWPEQQERRNMLAAAVEIVRADPPLLVAGDLTDALASLAAQAPPEATLVVISSGVLVYLVRAERDRFAAAVRTLDAHWLSLEAAGLFPGPAAELTELTGLAGEELERRFALTLDGHPLALVGAHGQSIEWLAG